MASSRWPGPYPAGLFLACVREGSGLVCSCFHARFGQVALAICGQKVRCLAVCVFLYTNMLLCSWIECCFWIAFPHAQVGPGQKAACRWGGLDMTCMRAWTMGYLTFIAKCMRCLFRPLQINIITDGFVITTWYPKVPSGCLVMFLSFCMPFGSQSTHECICS